MSLNYSAARILTNGITQAQMHGAPPEIVATLRGALRFCSQADQLRAVEDAEPTPYVERVPAINGASGDE